MWQRNECGLAKLPSAAESYSRSGRGPRTRGLERELQINFRVTDDMPRISAVWLVGPAQH
jgi:hypothetical protein